MGDVRRTRPLVDDEELLPTEIDGAMRADLVLRDIGPYKEAADIPSSALESLAIPIPRPKGITVELRPAERTIIVSFEGRVVAVLRWLQQGGSFHVKRRVNYAPGSGVGANEPIEYKCALPEMWRQCCQFGITIDEFQQAFKELPPTIEWKFDMCPWPDQQRQMNCKLDMKGDPRSKATPGLRCRVCKAEFSMDEKGQNLTLTEVGEDPDGARLVQSTTLAPPPPPASSVPFEKDFTRYQNAGKAKLEQLQAAGIGSWAQLSALEVEELVQQFGWHRKHAEALLEIAKEKT